jgi:hypothetical protein
MRFSSLFFFFFFFFFFRGMKEKLNRRIVIIAMAGR